MAIRNIIIVLCLAIIVLWGVLKFASAPAPVETQTPVETPPVVEVERTDTNSKALPEKFPSNFPLETGAKVTQNFTTTFDKSHFESTRSFETKKTPEANLKLWQDFLVKDGWTVGAVLDQPSLKMIGAKKGDLMLEIIINSNANTKINTVTITLRG